MRAQELFSSTFGGQPDWLIRAPGRVNLIGEHVDYNQGLVLPLGINRATTIAARVNQSSPPQVRVKSEAFKELADFELGNLRPRPDQVWWSYIAGVFAQFERLMLSKTQDRLPGFDIAITSDVPMGCGLSSSAALAVTVAELLDALLQTHLSPIEKAQICRAAEHEFAGVPCGLMDQLCVAACEEDQCMLIDFHANAYRFVPLDDSECVVMIADSKIKRGLAGSEYALRAEQCFAAAAALGVRSLRQAEESLLEQRSASLDAVHQRRVRHVIREIARVREAADCLERKDWPAFGKLMNDSHVSLRDDFEVSCAELNTLVEIAQSLEGVLGSRMTGGGFGGCTVSLVRKNFAGPVREQMSAEYLRRTGISPAVFTTPACAGVQVLQRPDSAS